MQSKLAPIGISTYSRIHHLQKTVEALKNNLLASQSELFIFSDAPKAGDEEIVNKVRSYIHTITGFKKIHIIERSTNGRVKNNRGGIQDLLDTYGKCIFMEDDIVTAPGFLNFVNKALETYEENEEILSVTGYTPPINIPNSCDQDFFVLSRFNGWGAGFWKKKYDLIEQKLDKYTVTEKLKDSAFLKKLTSQGMDIPEMLMREIHGEIDALDIKIMYQQALHGWYTLYPKRSLVQNVGHDGSGVHCDVTAKYHHESLWGKTSGFIFNTAIEPVEEIMKANYDFRFSMNRYAIGLIVENLMREIVNNHLPSVSVWGFGELAKMLVSRLQKDQIRINYIVDPYQSAGESHFQGVEVITPKQAMEKSEKIFVLGMWKDLETIERKIREMALAQNRNITVIYDKTIPVNL